MLNFFFPLMSIIAMLLIPPSLQRNKNKQAALLSVLWNKVYLIVLAAHMHISMELNHGYGLCPGWDIDAQATLKTHACLLGFMNAQDVNKDFQETTRKKWWKYGCRLEVLTLLLVNHGENGFMKM